jgi:hypothetical protein
MLEDVGPMGSLTQSVDEPARRSPAARVLAQRRKCFDEAIAEPGYVDRGKLLELTEANVAGDDWRQTPVVRTTQRADAAHAQSCGGNV